MIGWYDSKCVDTSKSKFFAEQIEYLGYWITRQGIQPIRKKVEINASLDIRRPKQENNNYPRQFIGIVNYYRNM
jgi:hypothetical protein